MRLFLLIGLSLQRKVNLKDFRKMSALTSKCAPYYTLSAVSGELLSLIAIFWRQGSLSIKK